MSGIHIAIPWPRGPPYERGALDHGDLPDPDGDLPDPEDSADGDLQDPRGPLRGPRPAAAGLLGAGAPRLRGCGPAPGELLRQGAGPGQGGARALATEEGSLSLGPHPGPAARRASGLHRYARRSRGRCALFPAPFLAGRVRPVLAGCAARPGPPPGRCAPVARLRPPPGAACGPPLPRPRCALAGAAGDRLAVWAPPCGALRAAPARPWPSPGGACARLRRRRVPLAFALRAGAAPRPGSSRPGAVRPGGRFCPPPPGVGVAPPAGGAQPVADSEMTYRQRKEVVYSVFRAL